MKIVYKIYSSCLSKDPPSGYGHVTPERTPDFKTEEDAEKYLLEQLSVELNAEQHSNWREKWNSYYFIQKTYILE